MLQTLCKASLLLFCELPYRDFHSYLNPAGVKEGCLFCLKEVSYKSQYLNQQPFFVGVQPALRKGQHILHIMANSCCPREPPSLETAFGTIMD